MEYNINNYKSMACVKNYVEEMIKIRISNVIEFSNPRNAQSSFLKQQLRF